MFTGLVTDVGMIVDTTTGDRIRRVRIRSRYEAATLALGASVACGGPCLTVVDIEPEADGCTIAVDVGAETLERTTAGSWTTGMRLNLERSLRMGDELGGHLVTGHIDAVAEVVSVDTFDGMRRFRVRAPVACLRFIATKGSVSLDGTSLTVNDVQDDVFSVLLIPHTLASTSWNERRVGDGLNLEVDLMARYAARISETASRTSGISSAGR